MPFMGALRLRWIPFAPVRPWSHVVGASFASVTVNPIDMQCRSRDFDGLFRNEYPSHTYGQRILALESSASRSGGLRLRIGIGNGRPLPSYP